MAREPDIQFFRESGTWHRPEGATRVEVMIKGGDGGAGVDAAGNVIPGAEGEVTIQVMPADEVGATAQVTIGKGGQGAAGAPSGGAGYAVVVTYFD